jgi:hypothetical protein
MSTTTDHPNLSLHLQQALNMLDLNPEKELSRYRQYKNGGLDALTTFGSAELIEESPSSAPPLTVSFASIGVMTDEEDEDYEVIPPSEPFAVYEDVSSQVSPQKKQSPAGEMVLTGQLPESESLNLSLVLPGEIEPVRDEYLPASQELWRSLGQTAPLPVETPISKWKVPLAIGSSLLAIATVSGMSYVNMHPALLKGVPLVSQLTAVTVPTSGPPGEVILGPDLALGEFSDLSLSNINSITIPGQETAAVVTTPKTPTTPSPETVLPATTTPVITPPAPTGLATAPTARLADGLIRNLLPPNIQQLAGQQSPASSGLPTVKPYVANQLYYQPPTATAIQPRYSVFTKYVNPLGMAKIQSLVPAATLQGNRIYLGSFPKQSAALGVVEQMQEQGIKAWLVRPASQPNR